MGVLDKINESPSELIDTQKLAQELGVQEKHFRYGDAPERAKKLIYECVGGLLLEDKDGRQACFVTKEEARRWYDLFDAFEGIDILPLLINKTDIEKWRMDIFVIHLSRYFTLGGLKYKLAKMENIFMQNMLSTIPSVAVNGLNEAEIKSAFGIKFFTKIAPLVLEDDAFLNLSMQLARYDQKYHELTDGLKSGQLDAIDFANTQFWSRQDLPLVKLFIDNNPSQKKPSLDVSYLDRLLCHANIHLFSDLLDGFTHEESKHIPTWIAWIQQRGHLLFEDTETLRIFLRIFGIEGQSLIIPKNKGRLVVHKKIPTRLHKAITEAYIKYPPQTKNKKPAETVAKITSPAPSQTAMAALITSREPAKIVVSTPDIKTIFPDLEEAKKNKTQLTQIDFSQCDFPEGTTVQVERSLPAKKPSFDLLNNIDARGLNSIPAVFGRDIQGHFIYRITISLPSTHRFENRNIIEVSYYAKAEPTPAEIEAEKIQQDALRDQPKAAPTPASPVIEKVVEKVEKIIDPTQTSLIAAAFVLEENLRKYGNNDMYEGGPIEIVISDADASEVLGEEAKDLLPGHRTWIIQEDNTISPSTDDTDIHKHLTTIAGALRAKAQTKIEKQQEQEKQTREQAEYEQERLKFTPILEFARGFQFEGKQNGHFDAQKKILIEELRALGWSLPVPWSGSQVKWRHIGPKVEIIYTSKQCISFVVNGEQSELTTAQKKCYEEVAQAFAHIARFFNVEAKERTRMVNKEKAIRKETETGAVAYDKLLQEGRARLVLFGPYQGGHGVWSSKFPTEKNPFMLDERASYDTIESLLQQYPHAELCYRRDQLCINGEIAQDASQESIENVSLNMTELRQSPRARYILKKRILITLKLEKYSDETDRAPIKHEKNKKEGGISALDILQRIQKERGVQSASDVTEDFLNYYIDELENNRIRVHYVWPLSSRLDEHQARMRKHAAKIAKTTESTAD